MMTRTNTARPTPTLRPTMSKRAACFYLRAATGLSWATCKEKVKGMATVRDGLRLKVKGADVDRAAKDALAPKPTTVRGLSQRHINAAREAGEWPEVIQ